ncbi:TonB-dependent receptor [Porphyromonadaceae bacterium W3.11]|nr:TonB-dependent receptor [Porphyromonadaceae bacterium W3.11]
MKSLFWRGLLWTSVFAMSIIGVMAENLGYATEIPSESEVAYKLKGKVVDAYDDTPLAYATVVVLGTSYGATTNVDGYFEVKDLVKGTVTVRVSFVGYGTREIKLDSKGDHVIKLEPTAINMEEVVVSASRNETRRNLAPVLVNVTDAKLFTKVNAVTLDEALKYNPGVRVEDNCQNCGFNQVRINGLDGTYSQIVINSRSIFSSLAGVYALELFPTSMIDRVEVVRGGGSALYGSAAIGGTVNVITKTPTRNTAEASYIISGVQDNLGTPMHDAGLFASVVDNSGRAGVSVFGKMKSRPGLDLKRPGSAQPNGKDGFSDLPQLHFATLGTSAFYSVGPATKLSLDYFYTQEKRRGGDRLDRPEHEAQIAEAVKHRIHTGILKLDQNLADGMGFLNVFVAGSHIDRDSYYGGGSLLARELREKHEAGTLTKEDIDGLVGALGSYGNTKETTLQAGTQYSHNFDKLIFMPAELTAGFEFNHNDLKDISGYRPEAIDQVTNTTSLFLQNEWKNDVWGFLIGGRYDHVDLKNGDDPSKKLDILTPRVTLRFNPIEKLHIRATYGQGFRSPQFFDEELHVNFAGGEGKPSVLSANLHEEKSHSTSLSADYYLAWDNGFKLNLMAEGFYTRLLDKFNHEDRGDYLEVVNASNASVYGANLELRLAYTNIATLDMGFTAQRSLFDEEEEVGIDGINSREFMRTPNTYGYFLLNWTPSHHFSWSLSGNYTGKMYVPHEAGDLVPGYITIQDGVLERSKAFFTLGTKVSYAFHMEDAMMEFSIGAQNIFNSYQKDFDEGSQRASAYIYGPKMPRTIFAGIKVNL